MAYSCSPGFAACLMASLLAVSMTGCSAPNQPTTESNPPVASGTKSPIVKPQDAQPQATSPSPALTTPPSGAKTASSSTSTTTKKASENSPTKQVVPDLAKTVAIAKQDPGKTYLSNLLLLQQTEKLVKGRFSSDLKSLAADVPTETEDYRIEIRTVDPSKAVMVAIAKQPGFSSYTGVVYTVEAQIPVAGLCKTNVPSQIPPQPPKLVHGAVMCPQGASAAN